MTEDDAKRLAAIRDELAKWPAPEGMEYPLEFLLRLLDEERAARQQLHTLLNTPQTLEFIEAVRIEAAHQVDRWGPAHDRGKSSENWFWLIGYLAGKALRSAIEGDTEKALHHTISSAAACANWHAAILAHGDRGDDRDLEEIARFEKSAELPQ
jgi:hypothetical protein